MSDILNNDLWHIDHADSIERMHEMPPHCIDFAIFSPPFPSTFAYTNLPEDLGNSENLDHEAKLHFSFFFAQFVRMLKPGRVAIVHCAQIGRLKRAGEFGLFDFRGMLIRLAQRAGLIYEYDWLIRKNPQAQAIRTKKWELKFQGIETDRAMCRGTLCDYLLKFRAPGENKRRINTPDEVTRETWIKWAEGCWDDILETDTLNTAEAKSEEDTKHICPLQLEPIRRCVLLYTEPDDIVFSPFGGVGSEGFVPLGGRSPKTKRQIRNQRRFYGIELKDEYFDAAQRNCEKACKQFVDAGQLPLFGRHSTDVEIDAIIADGCNSEYKR
jgi:DNA modification methylase